jgi:membrane peptidoglycan carboxypeptidase
MSDCTARFLIWQCGQSNDDLALDIFVDGAKLPAGVKTGTQQGATSAEETLETWLTGYSRYAATAVWIGNADKSPVRDGPAANYASANTTLRLYKNWMAHYHEHLRSVGIFSTPAGFEELQPANVKLAAFQSAATERGRGGGCYTRVSSWQRTDVDYRGGDCLGKSCFEPPTFKKDHAVSLARSRGIPACGVYVPPTETPTPEGTPTPNAREERTATPKETRPPSRATQESPGTPATEPPTEKEPKPEKPDKPDKPND